ncbi:methylamine utilization protein MauE [Cytobacillus firmus]|uniref:Methylamine utilization protein MauE n=2 Tax=Cytobacillus TaxID=2675230 RepID=A0A366JHW5_CYTFI|nr:MULTISPECIES: MauE/DoxX family redox-associated membrane protein [Cytobacillus]RBP86585.1 methylamine utilization protein MauE [Cytobacillus firmus]TDX39325.1 methylamine utilization protein MauE [Cytobacillus oceanisediminis]
MKVITMMILILTGYIFLFSSLSKLKNMEAHLIIVKEYKILPLKLVRKFAVIDTSLEIITGICLILGLMLHFSLIMASILLIIYSLAIIINLLRGRSKIDCGCGGLMGSKKLSWKLIIRNILLLGIVLALYFNYQSSPNYITHTFTKEYLISNLVILSLICTFLISSLLRVIQTEFSRLLKGGTNNGV